MSIFSSFPGSKLLGESSFANVNPSRPRDLVANVISATKEEIADAVHCAGEAQPGWKNLNGAVRADHLYKWGEAIQARSAELAEAIATEVGKPITEAKGEVGRAVAILRYYASEAVRPNGQTIPGLVTSALQYSQRRPLGVVGLITPWNFPLAIPLWKAAPALAYGNTVVMKSSEKSPLCSFLLAETAITAGMPSGAFNVLQGPGEVGSMLCEADLISAVSFTGSAKTGKKVVDLCARSGKKVQAEMGGKNPSIVLGDANLAQAATMIAGAAFRFAGQKCTATSRAIVEKSVLKAFLSELENSTESLLIGDALELTTAIGPVISKFDYERIENVIRECPFSKLAISNAPTEGFFVPATIFTDVDPSSSMATEEHFGPVLAVIVADSAEHAIELANASEYGLSASIFTNNLKKAMDYTTKIEAGMIRVNADTTGVDPHAPFGGVKKSSYGNREQGPAAIEFYTESVTVQINP